MIQDENISFERESDSYSPNFNVLHTNNFDPKFFSNPKPSPHQLYTSSISSLVEDSSSTYKDKKNETKKSYSFSTSQEKVLLMEVLKNRTMKSKKTDDFQLQISEKDEPKPTFDLKETDKIPKIVNINRIEMKFKQILREIRQKLLLKEFQKTKTRTIGFMNDFTMEILEKKSNSVVIFYPFLQLFNKKIIKLLQSISRILIRWFIVWRIFYFFFVIFMGFMISLEYFFKAPTNLSECSLIPISLILLTLNIFLEKIIFQKQKTDQSYQKITINYVKSNFLLDLISYLILVMNLANILSIKNFWSLLYLLQLHNYQPLQLYILKKTIFSSNFKQITVLVFLLIKTVVLSHFLACATYYFSSELSSEMFTWDIKYLSSLNDSLSLLFLINNENLKLITNKSLGFSYITTIVSAFWFLYIIKIFFIAFQTSQTPSSSDSNETLMRFDKNQYQNLLNCMIRLKMRKDLIINVRNYLDDIDHETGKALINLGNNQAFNKLSPNLKEAILASSQNKVFGTVPMLYRNFSEEFLRNLIPKMVLAHYNPENIIYNKTDIEDKFLFIIAFGKVELYVNLGKKQDIQHTFKIVPKGLSFGEYSFFLDTPKSHFAKALTPVSVYKISRSDFLDLLLKFPDDYEKYCFMKDSLRLYKDFKVLETLCTCCQEIDHDIENCPLLTLQLNRQKIIRRHLFSRSQERGILHRKYRKKMNALFRFKEIENKALKIEIPANFSSSCEGKSDNNSDDNTSRNISFIPRSDSNIKPKPLDSPTKDGSLKCYETFDELNMKTNSSKRPSFLGDSKSRIEKKEDSYKASNLDFSMDPLNPKFCSLELLIEEKNNKRQVNRSEMEINPLFNQKNNISNSAEEEREDNGTILTGNSGNSQQNIQKKNNFEKSKSNEDIKKRNSASYGSFSTNSLQNLKLFKEDHFFQTDEILGGTNKANTTTMATIQEFLLKNFEIKNSFKVYFPHNNYENVIKWCRILQKGKRKIVNKQ